MNQSIYDQIVIGAGFAGLCTAALLTKQGYKVLLIESHTEPGGCASFFKRKHFLFDVGATTLSGLAPNKPIYKVFKELDLLDKLNVKRLDVGISIKMDGETINRHRDFETFMQELEKSQFKDSILKIRDFYSQVHRIDKLAWQLVDQNERLLPVSLGDYMELFQPHKLLKNIQGLSLVPGLFRGTTDFLGNYGLRDHSKFRQFIDEQLLITTQNTIPTTPYLSAALGLAYSEEVFYPMGGIGNVSKILDQYIKDKGGEIFYKCRAKKITSDKDHYKIEVDHLKEKKVLTCWSVIPSIPIWNLAKITEGKIQKHFQKYTQKFPEAWGAFMVYGAFKTNLKLDSAYHQIHCSKPIPHCNSGSIFATISLAEDKEKAPEGWHTITVSTHTDTQNWLGLSTEEYNSRKQETQEFILEELYQVFPELRNCQKEFIMSGSPKNFEFFTSRENGYVGGIAHSTDMPIINLAASQLPVKDFYFCGDTSFPGQGLAAVAYSAQSIARKF